MLKVHDRVKDLRSSFDLDLAAMKETKTLV